MDRVIFFKTQYNGCIDRKNRFIDKNALDIWLNNMGTIHFDINGCIITESTGYFDLDTATFNPDTDNINFNNISYFGYALIKQNFIDYITETEELFCFIDKIEQNNFSENQKYYRVYFTIDWWTTLQNAGYELNEHIYGKVERGHINDVRKIDDKYIPDLEHTFGVEEEITGYNITSKRLPLQPDDLNWVYIILDPVNEQGIWSTFNQYITLRNKISCCTALLACLPVRNGVVEKCRVWSKDENGLYTILKYEIEGGYPVTAITDDQILGIFYSTIPPCEYSWDETGVSDGYKLHLHEWVYNTNTANIKSEIRTYDLSLYAQAGLKKKAILSQFITGMTVDGNYIKDIMPSVLERLNPLNEITISEDYIDYLLSIPKFHSSFYSPLLLRGGRAYDIIDMTRKPPPFDYINIQLSVGNGGIFSNNPTIYNFDLSSATKVVGENNIFMPVKIVNETDFYKAIVNGTEKIVNALASGVASYLGGAYDKMAGSIVKGVDTLSDIAFNIIENAQGSDTGYTNSQSHDYTMSEVEFEYYLPNNYTAIVEKLALYGYYTDLLPYEILTTHKRKYFNYIKTTNCSIMFKGNFTEQIKKDIENMFNSGVWLWNDAYSIGKYNLPNYPLIMYEV